MAVSPIANRFVCLALPILTGHPIKACHSRWTVSGLLVLLVGLQFFPEALLWQRDSILAGQYWRLLTGHLVHLNETHFSINLLAGLILVAWIKPHVRYLEMSFHFLALSFLLGAVLLFVPQLEWYGGLSGALHGLLCLYSIKLFFAQRTRWWAGMFALVWFKIAVEQWQVGSEQLIVLSHGLPVVPAAHLLGALLGTLFAITQVLIAKDISA